MVFRSLAFKLPAFVIMTVIAALTISGYLIDRKLLEYHRSTAESALSAGTQQVSATLGKISAEIHEEAQWLENQTSVLAGLSLIRDFEDPVNYHPILFNPEKQRIADNLQALIQNGRANSAYVFNLDNQLVSYAHQDEQGLQQGIVSFEQGSASLLHRAPRHTTSSLLSLTNIVDSWKALQHLEGDYHQVRGGLYYVHVHPLSQQDQTLGTLVLAYALSDAVFQPILPDGVQTRLISQADELDNPNDQPQQLLGAASLLHNDAGFWKYQGFARQDAFPGILLHYPASQYQYEQRITREGVIMAILLTAILVVPLSLWQIRYLILTPLGKLMQGIETIGAGKHQPISGSFSASELDRLIDTLNHMASQLQHRERRLKDYAQEMERLTHVMAHHFQEPSRRLMLFSSQLQGSNFKDSQDRQAVAFINAQATRLSTLVEGVRRYLELAQTPPDITSVDLNSLIQNVLENPPLASRIQQAGATIEIGTLPIVTGDSQRLYQLFEILVDNACCYKNAEKHLNIKVWLEEIASHWHVYVMDNGVGIAPEHRDQVFSLFTRLVTDSEQPGIGLGLAIAYLIMRQLDGDMSIYDSSLEGTTFRLSFNKGARNA